VQGSNFPLACPQELMDGNGISCTEEIIPCEGILCFALWQEFLISWLKELTCSMSLCIGLICHFTVLRLT
jgi:hypothetical protein